MQYTELSLTLTFGTVYDMFLYDNAGTLTLETLPWSNGWRDGIPRKHPFAGA